MTAAPLLEPALSEAMLLGLFRPKPRPTITSPAITPSATAFPVLNPLAVLVSPRPVHRPANLPQLAATLRAGRAAPVIQAASRRGSVCGVNAIKGETLEPIPGRIAGCGVEAPVRISAVSGLTLSQQAVIDCETARALNSWVREGVIPAVGRRGGGAAGLKVIAHYACRTRNNQPGAKISEHGKGHAVDIAGVILKNGQVLSVLDGWRDAAEKPILVAMHRAACGPFGTVLGPDADGYHRDHFHLDTARYRGGPYCR